MSRAMSETGEEEKEDDLSETGEEQSTVARTFSWTCQILGMLLGTATAISIIRSGFSIDLYGLPAKVLAQYIWLRDTLFVPVVWAVRYFGIEIAWWVKDTVMAYALLAAAHARAYQVMSRMNVVAHWAMPSRWGILLWPKISGRLIQQWARLRADRKYFARSPAILYGRHPDRLIPLHMAEGYLAEATERLGHIGLQLVLMSVATMAFFLWNYLSGVFGPT